jgi:preprotein translocase subunit SecE
MRDGPVVFKQRAQAAAEEDKTVNRRADKDKSERRVERKDKKDDDAPRKGAKSENRLIRYFQETSVELRKVAWPTREQTTRLTLIVLGTVLAFALFFGAIDLLFEKIIALLV